MVRDVLSVDQSLIRSFILFIVKHWAVRFRAKCSLVFDDVAQICDIRSTHIEDEYAAVLLKRISTPTATSLSMRSSSSQPNQSSISPDERPTARDRRPRRSQVHRDPDLRRRFGCGTDLDRSLTSARP
jgi:hypothetical protein